VLVAARLLKPLGSAPPNSVKYLGSAVVLEMMEDQCRLAKVTNAITQHWQKKNRGKARGASVGMGAALVG